MPSKAYPYSPPAAAHQRVQQAAVHWAQFRDKYVLSVIQQGLKLHWVEGFDPLHPATDFRPRFAIKNPPLPPEVKALIEEMVADGSLLEINGQEAMCISPIFAIDKKEKGKLRLITNLRGVNDFLETTPFHLPSLQQILPFIKKGMWATSVDLKAAYTHLPIHPRDKPWLVFQYEGHFYQHQALPFGLSVAPREWQRLMDPIVQHVRKITGCLCWVYLDDFLLLAETKDAVQAGTDYLVQLLSILGLEVNWEKSVLQAEQRITYLGFVLDLCAARLEVPKGKLKAVLDDLLRFRKVKLPTCRKLASIIGRLRSLAFAVPHIRLLSDQLVRQLKFQLRGGWEAMAPPPPVVTQQLEQALDELLIWKGANFQRHFESTRIYTDASDAGWGATLSWEDDQPLFGQFRDGDAEFHINMKEALAAVHALEMYQPKNCTVHLITDSTTLFWYIKHWGGRSPQLNEIIRRLWDLCQVQNLNLEPHFVFSEENPADGPSRRGSQQLSESSLHPEAMKIVRHWAKENNFQPKWDWMASESNAQCEHWISEQQNWFLQDLRSICPGYLNPPFHLIPHILNRWINHPQEVQALVIFPHKPKAAWFLLFERMRVSPLLLIQNSWDLFIGVTHEPLPRWGGPLMVAILQGQGN